MENFQPRIVAFLYIDFPTSITFPDRLAKV